jgi:anti-sigma B factor antagonist
MKIDERAVDGVTILDLQGKMLIGEGDELLREKINQLVENGTERIVLNLAEVPYVDSAGLGEIVRCYTTVSRKNGKLKLLHLTKRIHDLLSITKLLTVFETYDTEEKPSRVSQQLLDGGRSTSSAPWVFEASLRASGNPVGRQAGVLRSPAQAVSYPYAAPVTRTPSCSPL